MDDLGFVHAAGAASTFPPPLLPAHATLDNYRELFEHAGMGRYMLNSVLVATAITLLSLVLQLSGRLRVREAALPGRDRLFRTLLGALVIPAQVAMIPLFAMMK